MTTVTASVQHQRVVRASVQDVAIPSIIAALLLGLLLLIL
jgi:hypothetical protein